jgi:hypothetical protein
MHIASSAYRPGADPAEPGLADTAFEDADLCSNTASGALIEPLQLRYPHRSATGQRGGEYVTYLTYVTTSDLLATLTRYGGSIHARRPLRQLL